MKNLEETIKHPFAIMKECEKKIIQIENTFEIFENNNSEIPTRLKNLYFDYVVQYDKAHKDLLCHDTNSQHMRVYGFSILLDKLGSVKGNQEYLKFEDKYDEGKIHEWLEAVTHHETSKYEVKKYRTLIKYAERL